MPLNMTNNNIRIPILDYQEDVDPQNRIQISRATQMRQHQEQLDAEIQYTAMYYPELVHPPPNPLGVTVSNPEHMTNSLPETFHPPGIPENMNIQMAAGGGNPQIGNPGFAVGFGGTIPAANQINVLVPRRRPRRNDPSDLLER